MSATIPGFKCELCLNGLTDGDCKQNYSDHPHDGYWCSECLKAYTLDRAAGLAHLRARRHDLSRLDVDPA